LLPHKRRKIEKKAMSKEKEEELTNMEKNEETKVKESKGHPKARQGPLLQPPPLHSPPSERGRSPVFPSDNWGTVPSGSPRQQTVCHICHRVNCFN
jgi:hypothetical protein